MIPRAVITPNDHRYANDRSRHLTSLPNTAIIIIEVESYYTGQEIVNLNVWSTHAP